MKNLYSLLLVLILLTGSSTAIAQMVTMNDGFEGPPTHHVPPPGWNNCNDDLSTVDTQPGIMHNTLPASQGSNYISMVTREFQPPGTVETLWATLNKPFEKDHCYTLKLDLTLSSEYYGTLNWTDYYFNNPCKLQVLGMNGDCAVPDEIELLWQSEIINHLDEWRSFEIPVRPTTATFNQIELRVEFTEPGNFKNSALMIDNLRFNETAGQIINNCGLLNLPQGSTDITWYFNNQVISGTTSQLPMNESGRYSATYYNAENCFVYTSGDFINAPETIHDTIYIDRFDTIYLGGQYIALEVQCYPNPTFNDVTIEYNSPGNGFCNVTVFDNDVKEVIRQFYPLTEGNNKIKVYLNMLAAGTYYIQFEPLDKKSRTFKIVKLLE